MGSGRQAAQNISFQDSQRGVRLDSRQDRLEVKEEARCETEAAALAETQSGAPAVTARRLGDFSVVDEAGSPEPLESSLYSQKPLFLCGVVYPRDGPATKDTGRRVERVGPLRAFSLALAGKEAGVVVATAAATYTLSRPSAVYRKHFGHLAEQAALVLEVHHALSPAHGGTTAATLEEVIARLARTKVVKGYATAREGLLVNGKFVLAQLAAADAAGGAAAPQLAATGFAAALGSAVQEFRYEGAQRGAGNPGGIVIARDGGAAARAASKGKAAAAAADGGQMDADEEFARQMQAKIDNEMRNK
jgi:DNA (cytosine-5)-methyltransferase 1